MALVPALEVELECEKETQANHPELRQKNPRCQIVQLVPKARLPPGTLWEEEIEKLRSSRDLAETEAPILPPPEVKS